MINFESVKKLITYEIESQKLLKEVFLHHVQELVDSSNIIQPDCSDTILNILQEFENILEIFNTNDILLDKLKNIEDADDCINIFLCEYETILKNNIKIETFFKSLSKFFKLNFDSITGTPISPKKENDGSKKTSISSQSNMNVEVNEKTLFISESKQKVILPYSLTTINDILENNPGKYLDVEDVISREYTLPMSQFKNATIARFREAFNLMKNKEKKSIRESFELGMELLFNSSLHPAIITACNTLDELDFYLECLENNETDKFDCFKVIFDIAPVSVK